MLWLLYNILIENCTAILINTNVPCIRIAKCVLYTKVLYTYIYIYVLYTKVFLINIGSPASKVTSASQSSHGTGSPVSKIHGTSFVTSTVKVHTFE